MLEADKALDELFEKTGAPDTLYIHSWEGGHQDHDAAHILGLAQAIKHDCLSRTFQFSLYNGYALPWIFYRVLAPILSNGTILRTKLSWTERWRYMAFCCSYPSQFKTWLGLFPFTFFDYLFDGHQKLQRCDLNNIKKAPHEGVLLYEARKVTTYETFRMSVNGFIQEKCITLDECS